VHVLVFIKYYLVERLSKFSSCRFIEIQLGPKYLLAHKIWFNLNLCVCACVRPRALCSHLVTAVM